MKIILKCELDSFSVLDLSSNYLRECDKYCFFFLSFFLFTSNQNIHHHHRLLHFTRNLHTYLHSFLFNFDFFFLVCFFILYYNLTSIFFYVLPLFWAQQRSCCCPYHWINWATKMKTNDEKKNTHTPNQSAQFFFIYFFFSLHILFEFFFCCFICVSKSTTFDL